MSEALDLRKVSVFERHTIINERLKKLKAGESFVFLYDHEPQPLYPELKKREFKYESKLEPQSKLVVTVIKEK